MLRTPNMLSTPIIEDTRDMSLEQIAEAYMRESKPPFWLWHLKRHINLLSIFLPSITDLLMRTLQVLLREIRHMLTDL